MGDPFFAIVHFIVIGEGAIAHLSCIFFSLSDDIHIINLLHCVFVTLHLDLEVGPPQPLGSALKEPRVVALWAVPELDLLSGFFHPFGGIFCSKWKMSHFVPRSSLTFSSKL